MLTNDGFPPEQPSLQSLVERISEELSAQAVLVLHENGQVLYRSGWADDNEYPAMAALVAAMISAGRSLGSLGDNFSGAPSRFACDSDRMGLYTVAVTPEVWLAVIYDQPLNPGHFRMKVRRYSEMLARLGVQRQDQWEVTENGIPAGATLPPVTAESTGPAERITGPDSSLFANITDEEIDELFENARS
ncbi:MAG TPA: hypothetical protein VIH99_03525 [Bdellovibrionota bacterium]